MLASDIVAPGLVENEALQKGIHIFFSSAHVDFAAGGGHGVRNFFRGNRAADAVEDKSGHAFQHHHIRDFLTGGQVFDDHRIVDSFQIVPQFLRMVQKGQGIGEGTAFDILAVSLGQVGFATGSTDKFPEGQGEHFDLHVASGNQRCDLAGQQIGVGACDVDV